MANRLRIGHGYDVHKFCENYDADKPLILAGFTLDERLSLEAHSDGDLVLHAVCDAILGAIAAGDIGRHFPDSDSSLAGVDSAELLGQVLQMAAQRNYRPGNIDVTVVAQVPRLAAHMQAMTASLAEVSGLAIDAVNIKATTTERLGFLGREEGMACHAVVLMVDTDD